MLRLRGAAAREAAAAAPKEVIEVKYMDGAVERVQKWTVETDPEAIVNDARTSPRQGSRPILTEAYLRDDALTAVARRACAPAAIGSEATRRGLGAAVSLV